MPPSQKKKELKTKLQEYNAKYHEIEKKQHQLKQLIIVEDEMEFDNVNMHEEDEEKTLVVRRRFNKNRLDKSGKEIDMQNDKITDTLKVGLQTENIAKNAMLTLRGQRDQLVNTVGLVKDIGLDLVRGEKLVKDINRRKLLNIAIMYMISNMSQPGILGAREQGQDVRSANIMAVQSLSNIVKSSLGPQGLDKMLVDDIGDVTITNDGATILKQLEVQHPAAKVLVELSQIQDREVGDGTTSVVILAAELLKRANELVKNKIHPTSIMSGYRLALRESVKFIQQQMSLKVDTLGREALINAAKTSMSSKLLGAESEFFAEMVVNAMQNVKTVNAAGEVKAAVKSVHILKTHGKSSKESTLVDGYAIEAGRSAQGMPNHVIDAKIAFIDFNLNKYRLNMGVQVLVQDPENLEKIRQREMDVTRERCKKIIDAGANVILCSKGIDDFALKYFVENNCIAIRRVKKGDMRRIAACTGGKLVVSLADMEGEEAFDPSLLGACSKVFEKRVGDWDYTFFEGMQQTKAQTIILRGANDFFLDEIERSLHDSLCVIKRVLESNNVVAGGGAVEVALSIYLDDYARTLGSREQLAIAEFSEALLVIPKTLAINAAKDATDLIAKLRVFHNAAQKSEDEAKKELKYSGLDLINGKVRNNLKAGVLEPAISKIKSLKFATEAAITILRIDDMIKLAPKEAEQPRR